MNKKHTLIVGGTRGIGQTLVKKLAKENQIVSVIGRRLPAEAQNTASVSYWKVDLLDQVCLAEILLEIIQQNGTLNNLIFFQRYRGKDDAWEGDIETTLTATKNVIEHLVDKFDKKTENSIVMVSSVLSHFIADEQPLSYHVAKAGLNQMVRYYAVALGIKKIRVNSVSFGMLLKEESHDFYLNNKQLCDLYQTITPLNRLGTSEEVANLIIFLCSSNASFITGQNITIDGGVSLQSHDSLARKLLSLNLCQCDTSNIR